MSKAPILYRLEGRLLSDGRWLGLYAHDGRGAKSRAVADGQELSKWPTYVALRVMKSDEDQPVWEWKKP